MKQSNRVNPFTPLEIGNLPSHKMMRITRLSDNKYPYPKNTFNNRQYSILFSPLCYVSIIEFPYTNVNLLSIQGHHCMTFLFSTLPILNRLFIIFISTLIVACGDSGDSGDSSNNIGTSYDDGESTIYSQDAIHFASLQESITIDLSNKVILSSGEQLEINDLTVLSDDPACQKVLVSGMELSLESFSHPSMCQFQYNVKAVANTTEYSSERMISQLVVVENPLTIANSAPISLTGSAVLPPIGVTLNNTENSIVSIKSQLATLYPQEADGKDFVLDGNLLVLGNGKATKTTNSSITYTPDNGDLGGITRILYSLTNSSKDVFKLGTIDVTVGIGNLNTPPIANSFSWDNNTEGIILGKQYTIDVTSIIDTNCKVENNDENTATNSCISDSDSSDKLQLTGIYAYDATVIPTAPNTVDSTKFNVTFNRTGTHDITYYISDHSGGYAVGIMRVDIPLNKPPFFEGPKIINLTAGASKKVTFPSVSDPEGKAVRITHITTPSEGSITDRDDTKLTFTYTPLTTTVGVIPIKITFTDADNFDTIGDVIFTVNAINTLTPIEDRSVTTPVNTAIRVKIPDFINGLAKDSSGTVIEKVTIGDTFGSQLGKTKVDSTDSDIIIYTPTNNISGVDFFTFSVTTDLGNQLSSYITVTIGTPPPLIIEDIHAKEDDTRKTYNASVICQNCDTSKYKYSWKQNNIEVSTKSSLTIATEDRIYPVLLTIEGEDVFGQKATLSEVYDLSKLDLGGYDEPAGSCDDIFNEYEQLPDLIAEDGEYWIGGGDGKYRTQCDMVITEAEAIEQHKQVKGGYTLVWSYSQKTNIERYFDPDKETSKNTMDQTDKDIDWTNPRWDAGVGVLRTREGKVNYNNFHITRVAARALGDRITRVNYTSDTSIATMDKDHDKTVNEWIIQTDVPVGFITGDESHRDSRMKGRYNNVNIDNRGYQTIVGCPPDSCSKGILWLYEGEEPALDAYDDRLIGYSAYNSTATNLAPWSISLGDTNGLVWKDRNFVLKNMFGGWMGVTAHHAESDLVYKCKNDVYVTLVLTNKERVKAYGCKSADTEPHELINNGEGYVIQWWVK